MRDQLVTHTDKIYDGVNKCLSITVHETANPAPGADAQAHADLQSGTVHATLPGMRSKMIVRLSALIRTPRNVGLRLSGLTRLENYRDEDGT